MRKIVFSPDEYYHIYNRGVEKRFIVEDIEDSQRFMLSIAEFNTINPIGSIYESSFIKEKNQLFPPLVSFVAYCLNPNHYHFIIKPLVDCGVQKFMQRLGTGYTMYFNNKWRRSGVLFQGKFKASHINSNEYLLHASVYVNLNNHIHQLGGSASKLVETSWNEYLRPGKNAGDRKPGEIAAFCEKDIILKQFRSVSEYKKFALSSLEDIIQRKKNNKDIADLLLE